MPVLYVYLAVELYRKELVQNISKRKIEQAIGSRRLNFSLLNHHQIFLFTFNKSILVVQPKALNIVFRSSG